MNTQSINLQLTAATQLLTALQAGIADLPAKYRNKLPGSNYIGDVIYRLQVAKAEVNGTAMPVRVPAPDADDPLFDIIDN